MNAHPAGAALGLICDRLGLVARLAAGPEGRTASGNLLKVLALARRLTSEGLSFRDVVERLAEDAPSLDLEEMSVEPVDADAVRLMNLHRAKGLEAPIVVLAELGTWRKPEPKRHVVRGAAGSRGWFTAGLLDAAENRVAVDRDGDAARLGEPEGGRDRVRGGREDAPPLRRRDAGPGHAGREPPGGQAGERRRGRL